MREVENWDTLHVSINDENSMDEEFQVNEIKAAFIQYVVMKFQVFGLSQQGSCWSLAEHIQNNNIVHSLLKIHFNICFVQFLSSPLLSDDRINSNWNSHFKAMNWRRGVEESRYIAVQNWVLLVLVEF